MTTTTQVVTLGPRVVVDRTTFTRAHVHDEGLDADVLIGWVDDTTAWTSPTQTAPRVSVDDVQYVLARTSTEVATFTAARPGHPSRSATPQVRERILAAFTALDAAYISTRFSTPVTFGRPDARTSLARAEHALGVQQEVLQVAAMEHARRAALVAALRSGLGARTA